MSVQRRQERSHGAELEQIVAFGIPLRVVIRLSSLLTERKLLPSLCTRLQETHGRSKKSLWGGEKPRCASRKAGPRPARYKLARSNFCFACYSRFLPLLTRQVVPPRPR